MHKLASVQALRLTVTFSLTCMKVMDSLSNGDLSVLAGVKSKLLSIKSQLETAFGIKPLLLLFLHKVRPWKKWNPLFNYENIIQ